MVVIIFLVLLLWPDITAFQRCENDVFSLLKYYNKKVLLRERKRHTTRRVTSARYAALSNGEGGTPSSPRWGVPHWVLAMGDTPSSPDQGVSHPVLVGGMGVPHPVLAGGTPGYPLPSRPGMGYPSSSRPGMGYPPSRPGMDSPHPHPQSRPVMGYPPVQTCGGVPPPVEVWTDTQGEHITFLVSMRSQTSKHYVLTDIIYTHINISGYGLFPQ